MPVILVSFFNSFFKTEIEITKTLMVMKRMNPKRIQLCILISGDVAWLHLTTICHYRNERHAP